MGRGEWWGSLFGEALEPWVWLVAVAAAMLSGFLIGIERERKEKPAGLKTLTLICVGAAIFTLASRFLSDDRSDVTRIAAQIIPGIGFLGAGAILRSRGSIVGLTTAATIWVVAAIGMMIGGGFVALGLLLTLVIVALLVTVDRVERGLFGAGQVSVLRIQYRPEGGRTLARLQGVLDDYSIEGEELQQDEAGAESSALRIRVLEGPRHLRRCLGSLAEVPGVTGLELQVEDAGNRPAPGPEQ